MPTDMITLKLEKKFLDEIDAIVKKEGYQSRTEFIREALRERIGEIKIKKSVIGLSNIKGSAKKDYDYIKAKVFEEISKRLK